MTSQKIQARKGAGNVAVRKPSIDKDIFSKLEDSTHNMFQPRMFREPTSQMHHQYQTQEEWNKQRQRTTAASPLPDHGCVRKVLHMYMHDYCLKQQYLVAAEAIAQESGICTEDDLPLQRESAEGLLLEWFSAFWDTYISLHKVLFSSPTHQSNKQRQQHQQSTSSNLTLYAAQPVPEMAKKLDTTTTDIPKMVRDASDVNESNGNEKRKRAGVLERSQIAQQQALLRMAAAYQGTWLEASAYRGPNGSVFQQFPSRLCDSSCFSGSPIQQKSVLGCRSAETEASQRKKHHPTVHDIALQRIHSQQSHHQQQEQGWQQSPLKVRQAESTFSRTHCGAWNAVMSQGDVSEEQQSDRRWQDQPYAILEQSQRHQLQTLPCLRQHQWSQEAPSFRAIISVPHSIDNAREELSQVASHTTPQFKAQNFQRQHSFDFTPRPSMRSRPSTTHANELQDLREKLDSTVKAAEGEWATQQQHQVSSLPSRNDSEAGQSASTQCETFSSVSASPTTTVSDSIRTPQVPSNSWSRASEVQLQDSLHEPLCNVLGIYYQQQIVPTLGPSDILQGGDIDMKQPHLPVILPNVGSARSAKHQSLPLADQVSKPFTTFDDIDYANFDWSQLSASTI